MKRFLISSGLILLVSAMAYAQTSGTMSVESQRTFVNQYCVGCHNDKMASGGLSFTKIDLAHPDQTAARAEKVILKLRTGLMPPAGKPRPDAATLRAFVTALEMEIDRVAATHPNPGKPALHRLNRT